MKTEKLMNAKAYQVAKQIEEIRKPSHTPTLVPALMPWKVRVVKYGEAYTSVLETADGKYIGEICGVENSQTIQAITLAQLIVKCVNAHEGLVSAIKNAIANMKAANPLYLTVATLHGEVEALTDGIAFLEEALAQAEGE